MLLLEHKCWFLKRKWLDIIDFLHLYNILLHTQSSVFEKLLEKWQMHKRIEVKTKIEHLKHTETVNHIMWGTTTKINTTYIVFCEIWNYCFFYTMQKELQKDHYNRTPYV